MSWLKHSDVEEFVEPVTLTEKEKALVRIQTRMQSALKHGSRIKVYIAVTHTSRTKTTRHVRVFFIDGTDGMPDQIGGQLGILCDVRRHDFDPHALVIRGRDRIISECGYLIGKALHLTMGKPIADLFEFEEVT